LGGSSPTAASSPPVPPLTIVTLAIRQADYIADQMGKKEM
jgi:hypothetical protein